MISRAVHHRTARQDLPQHARRTQREPLRQDVIRGDAALADQKTDVRRQVANDLHQEGGDLFAESQTCLLIGKGEFPAAGEDHGRFPPAVCGSDLIEHALAQRLRLLRQA